MRSRTGAWRHYWLSRGIVLAAVAGALGTLLWTPTGWALWLLDVLLRGYLMFLGTVMAHEGVHGHLGRTRAANFGWGRLALVPTLVPFTNFRKTHHLHHAHTNHPDRDPDHFMNCRHFWQIPLRALAMPHQWFFWLRRRGGMSRADLADLALNYVGIAAIHGLLVWQVGWDRFVSGVAPPLALVSVLLWYPFALKTHEGFSTGTAEARSHDYFGKPMYWLSLGLSMHRVHHLRPGLSWLELRGHVRRPPGVGWLRWLRRDIRPDHEATS